MHQLIQKHEGEFAQALEFIKKEVSTIQTGRANAALVEDISVEAYGVRTPLKQLASIGVPEARTITIEPWDKNIGKDIEKAIRDSGRGLNPINEGGVVRINIPQMTEETRKDLLKLLNKKIEEGKIKLRAVREKIREEIIAAEKSKEITEDDKYALQKELDEVTGDYNKKVEEITKKKEEEITTI
ncbi:MAG: ribosome recycling factor [Patescibacteria group bacterium]|nr:ribosome recycling factor [Patescibacteria group bacterium]MDD5490387.1 ribosome recycling factor [Patescibacteria group bacterium]